MSIFIGLLLVIIVYVVLCHVLPDDDEKPDPEDSFTYWDKVSDEEQL